MAGHNKKNTKDQQWTDKRSISHKVKKPTIKEQTLKFNGHLVPIVVDHKRGSVYRDYANAWVVPCKLAHNKEDPYEAMVRDYGPLVRKYALVPTVHQLGKRDDVVQSASMFNEEERDENLALAASRLTRDE